MNAVAQEFSLSDAEHNQLVLRVGELVSQLEQLEPPEVREQVMELVQSLDLLHREALYRLVGILEKTAPGVLPVLLRDPVVQTLLLLYDFVPQPQEAPETPTVTGFVPLSELQVPVWVPAGQAEDFPEGVPVAREVNQQPLLLCRLDGRIHAVLNRCLDSILPLQLGRLEGETMVCPWHGCRYRLSTGELEGTDRRLPAFPVQVASGGQVRVGFNIPVEASEGRS